ncbi:MAG: hypothetical protein JXL85_00640 [Bacilli bacterium]|nr:hypothetical protein [Bacilli bacterium]
MLKKDLDWFNKGQDLIQKIDDYLDEINEMKLPNVQKTNILYELKFLSLTARVADNLKKIEKIEKKLNKTLIKLKHYI